MNQSKITVRYAKALFQAAVEGNQLKEVMTDLELLMEVYADEKFCAVLNSPVVKTSDKLKVTRVLFSGKISGLSMNFIELILSNKRERHLPDITRYFNTLYKKRQGILSAEVVVPGPVDTAKKETFRELLKKAFKSEIILEEIIKPEIIGGFILRVEDEQFDASVASNLSKIKKQLLETSSVKY